jgi:23S rRNA pseudouridine955/2504/2580 synthase
MTKEIITNDINIPTRVDRYLRRIYPGLTQGILEKMLRGGKIRLNGAKTQSSGRLKMGDKIEFLEDMSKYKIASFKKEAKIAHYEVSDVNELIDSIIYKDNQFMAINKPFGLAVQGGSKISKHIDAMLDELKFELLTKPKLVHRLDKDTTGVLLLGRTTEGAAHLTQAFRDRKISKTYIALCYGKIEGKHKGKIEIPLLKKNIAGGEQMVVDSEGDASLTHYEILAQKDNFYLMKLEPHTGLTHQLRVHMAYLGAPIYGDMKYGRRKDFVKLNAEEFKLHLHDYKIGFKNFSGKFIEIMAPLPKHILNSLKILGMDGYIK